MEQPQEVSVDSSKKSKKKQKQSGKQIACSAKDNDAKSAIASSSNKANPKSNKNLADELKLFQNSNLLNQQDPLEQLQVQINRLIKDDDQQKSGFASHETSAVMTNHAGSSVRPHNATECNNLHSLSSPSMQIQHNIAMSNPNCRPTTFYDNNQNVSTIKKGVLWQQQNYDKFHQRLFSRWKKRYFILTTDYLVCFKRSSAKVGHSEMGKFLYKTSLSDVTKIDWLKPKKSDKGAIIIYLREQFNLFLWSKKGLDEWMLLIGESIERLKSRRCQLSAINRCNMRDTPSMQVHNVGSNSGFYENTIASKSFDDTNETRQIACNNSATAIRREAIIGDGHSANGSSLNSRSHREETVASSRSSSGSRKPLNALVEMPSKVESHSRSTVSSAHANLVQDQDKSLERKNEDETGLEDGRSNEQNHRSPMINDSTSAPNGNRISQAYDHKHTEQSSNSTSSPQFNNKGHAPTVTSTSRSDNIADNPVVLANPGFVASDNRFTSNHDAMGPLKELNESVPNYSATGQTTLDTSNSANRDKVQALNQRVEGRRADKLERTMGNLIRRDDSWQSLVSLTQVGRNSAQVAQKHSLYLRHGPNDSVGDGGSDSGHPRRQNSINIESTVTPLRARLPLRQKVQSYSPRLPPIRQQHANSFDVPPIPSSPSLQSNQQTSSYHQKLLQLQLLHNSNNVDYIRSNNHENGDRNDYQIYGPESTVTTNHYGYYSMRSNLKSAASEFSFIRPSSSNFQPQAIQHSNSVAQQNTSYALGEQNIQNFQQNSNYPLVLSGKDFTRDCNNNNQIVAQGLVAGSQLIDSSERLRQMNNQLVRQHQVSDRPTLAELTAPNRELPLKPNRKRPTNHETQLESSSLGSSIKCFFKRAFSRRSKRKPKIVESCSSSLAAFDGNFESVQVAQSAFSTGSKSAKADHSALNQNQQSNQPQKMIDLIEAFANKTAIERNDKSMGVLVEDRQQQDLHLTPSSKQTAQIRIERPRINQNPIDSPLHKSNSISTSTGFSGLNELVYQNQNQRFTHDEDVIRFAREKISSPQAFRSTKVMSANLTPLFSRKESFDPNESHVMSNRNPVNLKHLPRPSSIYGQPSLISSPINSASQRESFGLFRNSLHGNTRDRIASSNVDFRRQQAMKVSYLDPTKEVAEELLSPNGNSKEIPGMRIAQSGEQIDSNTGIGLHQLNSALPMKNDTYQHQRQAVVNPILQSPTMNAIYDNHPSAINDRFHEVTYSHYDNHRAVNHQEQTGESSGYSQPILAYSGGREYYRGITEAAVSPLISNRFSTERSAQSHIVDKTGGLLFTPSREVETSRQTQADRGIIDGNRVFVRSKPAAIVAPTTPNRVEHRRNQSKFPPGVIDGLCDDAPICSDMRFTGQPSPMRDQQHQLNSVAITPIASRRYLNQESHYQQSPLVNGQTRILKKGGGVQTTILGCASAEEGEAVVNIVGAPGVNLDPALAASLLRGTNIDAFQSSTANRLSNSNHSGLNRKTFLVSSRLSQATTKEDVTNKKLTRPSTGLETRENLIGDGKFSSASSRDFNAVASSSSKISIMSLSENEIDVRDDVGTANLGGSDEAKDIHEGSGESTTTSRTSSSRRRGSSTEQSDEISSQTGSIDEPDEKNWINSKLVQ